jgi:NadR type nicotinamide-nucleotide adenylyltransferase
MDTCNGGSYMSLKFTRKLIITGPESAGKTTLAKDLAHELKVTWLPEYARKHLEILNRPYRFEDVIEMAQVQLKKENELFNRSSGSLILDTNLLVYKIWIQEKYNREVDWIEKEIAKSKNDFYLLCDMDISWTQDPLREHPKRIDRTRIFSLYHDFLKKNQFNFEIISGNKLSRLKKSIEIIDKLN